MKFQNANVLITGGASGIGKIMGRMALEKGAKCFIIWAIERNTRFRGIPFGFHFIRFWQAFLPTCIFDFFFGKVVGLYHAMDEFTGRKKADAGTSKAS